MLINWIASTISKSMTGDYNVDDVHLLSSHFCTSLLMVGVMKQIIDKDAPLQDSFCVSFACNSRPISMFMRYVSIAAKSNVPVDIQSSAIIAT